MRALLRACCRLVGRFEALRVKWMFTVNGVRGKQRPRVVRGRAFTPPETVEYERLIAASAINAGVAVGNRECRVTVDVWTSNRRRRDLDNILKIVLDGLQKAGPSVLADDCATVVREMGIVWRGVDKTAPRIVVSVEVLGASIPE